jgi:hypothetical protein
MSESGWDPEPPAAQGWLSNLSPNQQIGYGCLAVVIVGIAALYCAGTFSMIVRPSLLQRPDTPTIVVRATAVAPPTQTLPTLTRLPGGTLAATPTQAPIPTRELPTLTPTVDLTNPAPTLTVTLTLGMRTTVTPTRKTTPTMPRP